MLDYERPMTHSRLADGHLYDISGHFVWVGAHPRPGRAHIDFVASVRNPVGVKISPAPTPTTCCG